MTEWSYGDYAELREGTTFYWDDYSLFWWSHRNHPEESVSLPGGSIGRVIAIPGFIVVRFLPEGRVTHLKRIGSGPISHEIKPKDEYLCKCAYVRLRKPSPLELLAHCAE